MEPINENANNVCYEQTCFSSNDWVILEMIHQLLEIMKFTYSKDKCAIIGGQWKVLHRINTPIVTKQKTMLSKIGKNINSWLS